MNVNALLRPFLMTVLGMLIMAFAWPLRGQFGHEWGAAIAGAAAGAAVTMLVPQKNFRQAFIQAVFLGTLGFVAGGENIAYGKLVDSILAEPSLAGAIPQLLVILFIGASWGAIGGTYLGYGISEKSLSFRDYFLILALGTVAVTLTFSFSADAQITLILSALILLLQLYNFFFKRSRMVWKMGLHGLAGFGAGFLGAVVILYLGNKGLLPGPRGWWTLRDQIWGAAGGLSLILAAACAAEKDLLPAGLTKTALQRAGFIFFVPGICGVNTWDVYQKWFSSPPAPNPALAGALLAAGAILLIAWLLYYMITPGDAFGGPGLNRLILGSFLFFSFYLCFFGIAKSIVYSGWGVWETGFTLFVFESVLFLVTLPFILLGPQNP